MTETSTSPTLAPPGLGLPWFQAAFGRYLWLPYLSATSSWEKCSQRLAHEQSRILAMVAPLNDERMTRRVLVSGIIGIEDSSRFWSPAMVLEHLVIVGDIVADIVVALTQGREPPHHVRIADLKPRGGQSPAEAVLEFRESMDRYSTRVRKEIGDRHAEKRWFHPWFGRMSAHQWHCLSGLHLGIHRRQLAAILRH